MEPRNPTGKGFIKGSPRQLKVKQAEAKDRVVALIAGGHTVEASMIAVGRTAQTYTLWRKSDEQFKNRIDIIRNGRDEAEQDSFVEFRRNYFGHETYWHQHQIVNAVEGAEPMSITMILLPPEWGKTTTLEDYICYKLGPIDPNLRFCILSEAQSHARKIIGRISRRMTDRVMNANYIDRFGPFKPPDREQQKPWNADQITIIHNTSDERDPSVEVKSAGSAIYGARYDVIVLDDIQSTKNINQTPQLLEYFRQDVLTRAGQTGKIIIIGTRVGPGDFYEKLLEEIPDINLVLIKALDEKGQSMFPETEAPDGRKIGWGEKALAQRRKMVGEETWSRVYMQEPQSKHGATFTKAVIDRAKDRSRTLTSEAPGLFTIGMLDPALAGHCVHRIASYDYGSFYLMDGRNSSGLTKYSEIWDLIEELTIKWRPSVWVIEGNSLQGGLMTDERLTDLAEHFGFRIEAHQTGKNKHDETIGVASMEGSFLRGEISIPWGDEATRFNFDALPDELEKWRADVPTKYLIQDEVMALWFGYLYWQRARASLANKVNQRVTTRGLPYAPTPYRYARSAV
jgi:hypothetical protein